jgi:hypothetical protein
MINLSVGLNEFVIYADTITSDVQTFGDEFLIGFRSLYTNTYSYVRPDVIKRNSRFIYKGKTWTRTHGRFARLGGDGDHKGEWIIDLEEMVTPININFLTTK